MTLHRVVLNSGALNFASQPMQIIANVPSSVDLVVQSSGLTIGVSGPRLWDASIVPANYSTTLNAGQVLTLPLSADNLPVNYFDAIILVYVNGNLTPIAISNSPDNQGFYSTSQSAIDKNLAWIDLRCYKTVFGSGNNSEQSDFMFGGASSSVNVSTPYTVYFSEQTASSLSMTIQQRFYPTSGQPYTQSTQTVTVPAGVYSYQFPSQYWFDNTTGLGYSKGNLRFQLSFTDPKIRSLLPYFHWGYGTT